MLHGLPRRSTAIAAGVLLLSGALSSCGFDYATNRVNTISSAVNDRNGAVDILGAAIISGEPDTGVFVATLSNTESTDASELGETVALTEIGGALAPVDDLDPVPIDPLGVDNLYQRGGIPVAGSIALGDFIDVKLTFDNGQESTLSVPVVRPCYEYNPQKFPGMVVPGPPPVGETEFEAETLDEGDDEITKLTDPYSCDPIEPESYTPEGVANEGGDQE